MEAIRSPEQVGFSSQRLARIRPWMDGYVNAGKLPGAMTVIARHGQIAYADWTGKRDVEADRPWEADTLLRIYSMSKPICSVALMMLFEEGRFHLDDPVATFLPEFADVKVLVKGATALDQVEDCREPLTVHHLLTHTSGFTYGFNGGVLGDAYTAGKIDFGPKRGGGLAPMVKELAKYPLAFQPGSRWNYGVSTDVVGRLVEVISGQSLDAFLTSRIFEPLGMSETGFGVPEDKVDRFAALYTPNEDNSMKRLEKPDQSAFLRRDGMTFSGGGGLISTAVDYLKFVEMLRCKGRFGEERLLGPRTVGFMASNHLPGDLASMGQPVFSEVSFAGVGFGLGFSVTLNPAISQNMGSVGDHGWGGMASTAFWVDPVEDMVVMYMTQLVPSSHYPIRKELRALVHQALID